MSIQIVFILFQRRENVSGDSVKWNGVTFLDAETSYGYDINNLYCNCLITIKNLLIKLQQWCMGRITKEGVLYIDQFIKLRIYKFFKN